MGLWSWLFGKTAPELEEDGNRVIDVAYRDSKRHGPYKRYRKDGSLLEEGTYEDGEKHGPFVIHGRDVRIEGTYRAGKLHGIHRVLGADGSVQEEREYLDGEVVRGPHEQRDTVRKNWVRERGTIAHGKRDGLWREYGIPRADGSSVLLKRCHYKHGVLDGEYETWFYDGTRAIEGAYREDQRVGRWTFHRHDGSPQAEVEYADGAIVRWRWRARDGSERPLVPITSDDDLDRWLVLGDAWDDVEQRGTSGVQTAVDRWPAAERVRPLAWLDERIRARGAPPSFAADFEWLDAMADLDEPDPRTRLVDALQVDHHDWDKAQTRRLRRFASQLLEVDLVECSAHPDITALFDVPWPKLTSLALHECGRIDGVIAKLYGSPIEHLRLTYEPLSATAIHELVGAPWFPALQSLAVTVEDRAIVDAIAPRGMPELRELEIDCDGLELTTDDIARLTDRELRPTLARLVLNDVEIYAETSTK